MKQTLFLLLILGLGGSSCGRQDNSTQSSGTQTSDSTARQTAVSVRKTIVFFGNSLTAAYQLSPEQGFPALIQQKIDKILDSQKDFFQYLILYILLSFIVILSL